MDSGAAFHVMERSLVSKGMEYLIRKLDVPVRCSTVNGVIVISEYIDLYIPSLNVSLDIILAKEAPAIISMGRRIQENGFLRYGCPVGLQFC